MIRKPLGGQFGNHPMVTWKSFGSDLAISRWFWECIKMFDIWNLFGGIRNSVRILPNCNSEIQNYDFHVIIRKFLVLLETPTHGLLISFYYSVNPKVDWFIAIFILNINWVCYSLNLKPTVSCPCLFCLKMKKNDKGAHVVVKLVKMKRQSRLYGTTSS